MNHGDPRLDLELLADLDAGVLDPERETQVRAAAAADPEASALLAALAATRADLAALPEPPVPADVAARWDAALAAEGGDRAAAVRSMRAPAARRSHRFRPRPALVAAVVLAAAVVAGVLWTQPAAPDRLPSLDGVSLAATARAAVGAMDTGALADPARRAACLEAIGAGIAPDAPLLGGRRVEVGGEPAVLLLLSRAELGRFHAVVVDEGCGPDGGRLLRSEVVGR